HTGARPDLRRGGAAVQEEPADGRESATVPGGGEVPAPRDDVEEAPRNQALRLFEQRARVETISGPANDQRRGPDRLRGSTEVECVLRLDGRRQVGEVAELADEWPQKRREQTRRRLDLREQHARCRGGDGTRRPSAPHVDRDARLHPPRLREET